MVTATPQDADVRSDHHTGLTPTALKVHQVDLGRRTTEITVMVDAGTTTKTYTVTITRIAANRRFADGAEPGRRR